MKSYNYVCFKKLCTDYGAMHLQVVVRKGTGGWKKIVKAFGNDILLESGEIDRARLGQIVFSDPSKRQLLNRYTFH